MTPTSVNFARVHGEIEDLTPEGFRLCDTQLVVDLDAVPRALDVCIDVAVDGPDDRIRGGRAADSVDRRHPR